MFPRRADGGRAVSQAVSENRPVRFLLAWLALDGVCLLGFFALTWRELVPRKPKLWLVK